MGSRIWQGGVSEWTCIVLSITPQVFFKKSDFFRKESRAKIVSADYFIQIQRYIPKDVWCSYYNGEKPRHQGRPLELFRFLKPCPLKQTTLRPFFQKGRGGGSAFRAAVVETFQPINNRTSNIRDWICSVNVLRSASVKPCILFFNGRITSKEATNIRACDECFIIISNHEGTKPDFGFALA